MKKLILVKGVFSEDKGLETKMEEVEVVAENEKAFVVELSNEEFKNIYKSPRKYGSVLGECSITELTTRGLLEFRGYYKDIEEAKESTKKEVWVYLTDKAVFYEKQAKSLKR